MHIPSNLQEKRLTQRQRSEISKEKLIAATIDSLIESGYSATSTQEICNRAGLSKGGLFRQFTSRTDLMIATAECIYRGLLQKYEQRFTESIEYLDPIKVGLELVRTNLASREVEAAMELQVAARTDELLAQSMRVVIEENDAAVLQLAQRLFPEAAKNNPRFEVVVDAVVMMFRGEIFTAMVFEGQHSADARLKFIEDIVRREFAPNVSQPD